MYFLFGYIKISCTFEYQLAMELLKDYRDHMNTLKLTSELEVLRTAKLVFVSDLGGVVAQNWNMEQCGPTVWWSMLGYVDSKPVSMKYYQGNGYIEVNGTLYKLETE